MKRLILAAVMATTAGLAVAQVPSSAPVQRGQRIDADHDGSVSRNEAQAAADRRFARLDANHDGRVTADEFRARALARFERRDTNHDGRLDQQERMSRQRSPRG